MLRRVAAAFLALVVVFLPTARAGAIVDLGWWYKASGVVHCTSDANHYVCDAYDANLNYLGAVWDVWLDWYCAIGSITGGDNQGTPFRVRLVSPAGSGAGCLPNGDGTPNYWTQFYGWANGVGGYSGQNFYSPWYVQETPIYVFPRDAATVESQGTLLEIF